MIFSSIETILTFTSLTQFTGVKRDKSGKVRCRMIIFCYIPVALQKATAACSALGLSDTMLKSCIYDVAVTNDTSLSAQEILQQGE